MQRYINEVKPITNIDSQTTSLQNPWQKKSPAHVHIFCLLKVWLTIVKAGTGGTRVGVPLTGVATEAGATVTHVEIFACGHT